MDVLSVLTKWRKERIPPAGDIVPVYALTVFLLYGWMLFHFAWQIPSWIYFLSVGDILFFLASSLFVNLQESIVFILLILILCFLLPPKVLRDRFVVRGCALVIGALAWIAYFDAIASFIVPSNFILAAWTLAALAIVPAVVFLVDRYPLFRWFVLWLSDRVIVFLYLAIPSSLVSAGVMLARHILAMLSSS